MMKQTIITLACLFTMVAPSIAQNFAGDKIIGTYWVEQDGDKSKVRFSKTGANTYKAQIIWIEKAKDEKGNLRTDMKNPDKTKRQTPAGEIVLVKKVSYKDGKWTGGEIYDPTRGKSFTVNIWFSDAKTLCVKGSFGPFSEKVYWKKLE